MIGKVKTNFVIVSILMTFALGFFYLAYQDKYLVTLALFDPKMNRPEIGVVAEKKNNILRRFFGTPSYLTISEEESVLDLDYIYSGEKSEVLVALSETSSVKILAQSLVIFRFENGKKVIDLRDGNIEATIDPDDQIQLKVQKEKLDVLGEQEVNVRVSSKNGKSFFEGDKSGGQLKHKGKSYNLADGPMQIDENGDSQSLSDKLAQSSKAEAANQAGERLPSGLTQGSGKPQLLSRRDLPVPYPPDRVVMFHRKGADLLVYPSKKCKGECTITLSFNKRDIKKISFKDGENPYIHLKADSNLSGVFTWTYVDYSGQRTGSFEVRKFNPKELKRAMQNSKQIEVVN